MSKDPIIDLSRLPPPTIVEPWSAQQIYEKMLARYKELLAAEGEEYSFSLSDPSVKVLEASAYSEANLRQRFNDNVREVLLAYSQHGNLENLVALGNVKRKPVPGTEDKETDAVLRRRFLLAIDQRSTAGNEQGYVFHALEAGRGALIDAHAFSPKPGESTVVLLYHPALPPAEKERAEQRIKARLEEKKALTDKLSVVESTPVTKSLKVRLHVGVGVDPQVVRDESLRGLVEFLQAPFGSFAPAIKASLNAEVVYPYAIARNLYLSAIHAALTVKTVYWVELIGDDLASDLTIQGTEHLVLQFNPAKDIEVGPPFKAQSGGSDG